MGLHQWAILAVGLSTLLHFGTLGSLLGKKSANFLPVLICVTSVMQAVAAWPSPSAWVWLTVAAGVPTAHVFYLRRLKRMREKL